LFSVGEDIKDAIGVFLLLEHYHCSNQLWDASPILKVDGASELIRLDGNWRSVILVGIVLLLALAITGVASSAYKRERQLLGGRHYARGLDMSKSGETENAVQEFRKALLFMPDYTEYRLSLATALLQDGRLDEAQAHLEQLADEDPADPRIYLSLARIAVRRHKIGTAIQDYQRAVYEYWPPEQIPIRRAARWELVNLLVANGRRNEAVGELIQLYASSPPDPQEREKIGFLLLQYGGTSEARRIFAELVRIYPQQAAARRGMAEVEFAAGDYIAARHDFQRALRLDPNDHDSVTQLALTNAVIEMDAGLPGISAVERRRRSENLLRRVLKDLLPCMGAADFAQQVNAAQTMLTKRIKKSDDVSLQLQQAAQELWKQRGKVCSTAIVQDPAMDLVLARNANE
jgi:tetratricopeptide (TPR) repeat protein